MKKTLFLLMLVMVLGACQGQVTKKDDPNYSTLCEAAPLDDGYDIKTYPIAEKYAGLGFTGQLFTADDCGAQRLKELLKNYYLLTQDHGRVDYESTENQGIIGLWLKDNPSKDLQDTFQTIGFECGLSPVPKQCRYWIPKEIQGSTPVEDFLKLKAFSDQLSPVLPEFLCGTPPYVSGIGSDIYPLADKYKNLSHLGQIFTAADCNKERLTEVFGKNYYWGVGISLKKPPSSELLNTLKSVGFSCYDDAPEQSCFKWQLVTSYEESLEIMKDPQKVESDLQKLMKLKPFYQDFSYSGCINCG